MTLLCLSRYSTVERGSSVVECRTRNQVSPSSNPPLVPFRRFIHVNPPSFVRSLRHFDIAENLRPGDENLRHLAVTSRFKKCAHRSKVGEIIMWLARMRDYILGLYIFYARSFPDPTYFSHHDHANMKA